MSKKIDEAWEAFTRSAEVHDHTQLLREGWKSAYDLKGPRKTLHQRLMDNPNFESQLFKIRRGSFIKDIRFFRPITQ